MSRPGRKLKYRSFLRPLQPFSLYSPAAIVRLGTQQGLIPTDDPRLKLKQQRVRITLGRFASNHGFPERGDGLIKLRGQAYTPAWFGWRWQLAADIIRTQPVPPINGQAE